MEGWGSTEPPIDPPEEIEANEEQLIEYMEDTREEF